ncbi:GGDEF domain-containing protein [Nocardia sp. CDC160]|uniref:GGDEF domain-containing protein n=1 Tax=Nocardia sp. CDC160 TaxID=3112166 RepID=UPI002DBFEA9B|nr:GGDEF domain-containing protein [Nocardia sp. CDC160]MEC3919355.1 GGDEF domain-containing protein [Nocardia sp. CDC160]
MVVGLRLFREWWREDVDYRWVVDAIAARSALGLLKTAVGFCGLAAPVIAVLSVLSPTGPTDSVSRVLLWLLAGVGVVWCARWLVWRWPTERASLLLTGVADICITAVCALSPGYVVRSVGMMMLLIIGIYVSALHSPKMLVGQTVWSLLSACLLAVPLFRGGDTTSALIMILGMAAAVMVPPGLQICYSLLRCDMLSDPLTGLLSRRGLDYYSAIRFARAASFPASVMMIDLDRFKAVNDTYGHCAGDEVLVRTADRVRRATPPHSIVSRFGGEEFAVILSLPLAAAFEVADRIRSAIAEPIDSLTVTASIGLAPLHAPDDPNRACDPVRVAIAAADEAMYRAKQQGGNAVMLADVPVAEPSHARSTVTARPEGVLASSKAVRSEIGAAEDRRSKITSTPVARPRRSR